MAIPGGGDFGTFGKSLLDEGKEEIKEAFYQGGWTANRWTGSTMNTTPEDYYKMKFKK